VTRDGTNSFPRRCARHASETLKQMSKAAAQADVDVALASGAHARGAFGAGGAGAAASSAAAAAAARCAVACGAEAIMGDDGDDGGFDRDAPGAWLCGNHIGRPTTFPET
jgi:hypothetical protein